ncbi:MAG TPA: HlyD family efflux transporter periplasmic adaptor subunit, partial [Rhodopila sp.]
PSVQATGGSVPRLAHGIRFAAAAAGFVALMTVALVAAVVALTGFVGTQSYARKAAVTGYLAPMHGVVRVLAPRAGIITAIDVTEGDVVKAGDRLMSVRTQRTAAGGADLDETVRQSLGRQRDLQLHQVSLEQETARSEADRLKERIVRLTQECDAMAMQIAAQRDRNKLAVEQATVSRDLATQGFVSAVEQRRREDARISQAQALSGLNQQLAAKQGELVELRYALTELPAHSAARVATMRSAAAEIDTRLADAEGQHAYLVVAPAAGRVSAVQATVGNPADPTHPLLSIVPEGEDLQAVLFVPERAIGFVAPGQSVRLALDAFPFERFGAQEGTITSVAHTLLRPEQLSAVMQLPSEPSYRVTATLRAQSISAYQSRIPLQADMQLHANIIFDRRSFVQWLLDPVLSIRGRS